MRITVVGGGSWWTALAKILAEKGLDVYLLVRREAVCEAINREKEEETRKMQEFKREQKAEKILEKALKIKDDSNTRFLLGSLYFKRGKLRKARRMLLNIDTDKVDDKYRDTLLEIIHKLSNNN